MKNLKINQAGRSMVEMLGVLAIIGVLSVAGIAGYTTAMRSYRTNEIVNAASMLYIMAMAQNAGNGPTVNVDYTDVGGNVNPSGVSTLQYNKDTKEISITFTDPDDCIMAKNKLGDKATADCANKKITVNFGGETAQANTPNTPAVVDPPSGCSTSSCCPSGYIYIYHNGFTDNKNQCHKGTHDDASIICKSLGADLADYAMGEEEGNIYYWCTNL